MLTHIFKVKQDKHADAHTFTIEMPTTIDDAALIVSRYGSVERMIDRANGQWTVDVATGVRGCLPDIAKAEAYVEGFCDNGKKTVVVQKVRISKEEQDEQGFTEGQLALMAEKGIIL